MKAGNGKKQTIRHIIIFTLLVNALAWLGPILGGDDQSWSRLAYLGNRAHCGGIHRSHTSAVSKTSKVSSGHLFSSPLYYLSKLSNYPANFSLPISTYFLVFPPIEGYKFSMINQRLLLQTKLYLPPIRSGLVARPRLIEKLNRGLAGKLTLLSAPAGYGKTTLISEWLQQLAGEQEKNASPYVSWLSLDEEDNDPQLFFSYLAAAVQSWPNVQTFLSQRLQSPHPLPSKNLMKAFVHDLSPVSAPILLILDDYHFIESVEIESAMAFLLNHLPPQLHLVLATRSDPGFPISRWRARGQLNEVRADELRFTIEEAASFLKESMGISLSSSQIVALEKRTEGWIAGLQLAALSMQKRDDIAGFIDNFTGSHRFIMDYLTDEVLAQADPDVHQFLLQTAVLSRLSAPLCDAVLQEIEQSSADLLNQLEANNIFLVPLDDERCWYRYHHLFADLLRQKLPLEAANVVRKRAAAWSVENNLLADAIEYSLAATDYDAAAPLLAEYGLQFLFEGKLTTLQRWLDAFPSDYLAQQPRLCIHYGWVLLNQGRLDAIEPYLLAAESAAPEESAIRAVTALIRSNIARNYEDIPTAQTEAQIALQLTAPDNAMTRSASMFQLGAVQLMRGDVSASTRTLKQAALLARQSRNLNVSFLIGGHLGLAYLLEENPESAEAVLQETKAYAAELGLEQSPLLTYVHIGLAHLAFSRNELHKAKAEIEQALTHCQFINEISGLRLGYMLLAQIEQAAGRLSAAEEAFEKAQQTALFLKNTEISQQLHLLKRTLTPQRPPAALAKTVRFLAAGAPLSYAQAVSRAQPSSTHTTQPLIDPLTQRELEILTLIAAGLKNKEIAQQLIISLNTVLYHIKNIYGKLGVRKRVKAIAKAKELGLL